MINHIIQVSKEEKTKISTKELKCTKFEIRKMIMIAFYDINGLENENKRIKIKRIFKLKQKVK